MDGNPPGDGRPLPCLPPRARPPHWVSLLLGASDGATPVPVAPTMHSAWTQRLCASNTAASVAEWIGTLLADEERADVRTKLTLSGTQEPHAFVWVPLFHTAPWAVLGVLTTSPPPPPTKAATAAGGGHLRVGPVTWSERSGLFWASAAGCTRSATGGKSPSSSSPPKHCWCRRVGRGARQGRPLRGQRDWSSSPRAAACHSLTTVRSGHIVVSS